MVAAKRDTMTLNIKILRVLCVFVVAGILNSISFAQNPQVFQNPVLVLTGPKLVAYQTALRNLKVGFDDVCGDTFCEGDYSNLTSMDITCSMDPKTETMAACAWTFSGVAAEVSARTGSINTTRKKFSICAIDVSHVSLSEFSTAISNYLRASDAQPKNALEVIFTGKTKSIYDQLANCI